MQSINPIGVGGHLKKLIAETIEIAGLSVDLLACLECEDYSKKMDEWGPGGCLARMPTILERLEKSAESKQLPFVKPIAESLVREAIRRAEK